MSKILKSQKTTNIIKLLNITALDIGARHGFNTDLITLAPYINAIGFEPDKSECERLNKELKSNKNIPWKNLMFLPYALGKNKQTKTLNLYKHRSCSSILEADNELACKYNRDDYYKKEDEIKLQTYRLDEIASVHKFEDASFLKIDIQGFELEVLYAAKYYMVTYSTISK